MAAVRKQRTLGSGEAALTVSAMGFGCMGLNYHRSEHPKIYEWIRHLHLMRSWADMLNKLDGDVTVVHLPEAGLQGNTHFPMSDLNNAEVAGLACGWLQEKGLD